MPHKLNPSESSASSRDSSGDRVAVHDARDSSPVARTTSNSKDYKVVVHNGGGPSYDERRSASWDKGRWK
ncbi:hypothetical protein VTN00DRAFT_691 [Thermoascus crustaceus]|uniref:uncharacterized protein n=1 Tax=Thermoascus crustaceus TaxID=5088 RepID=UPI003743435B